MKKLLPVLLLFCFILLSKTLFAQINLGATPYILHFNGLTCSLPVEFPVCTAPVLTVPVAEANIYTSPDTNTNAAGCTAGQLVTINVRKHYRLVSNKIITPNSNCKNDTGLIKNIDYDPNKTLKVFDKADRIVFSLKVISHSSELKF